jgi:DNA-directed RNA polymerase subunit M/transcription elongation factor TFIIS
MSTRIKDITATTLVARPAPENVSVPIITPVTADASSRGLLKALLDARDIPRFLSLRYTSTRAPILTTTNTDVFREVMDMISQLGAETTYEFLARCSTPDDVIWGQPAMETARSKSALELNILRDDPKVHVSNISCPRCNKFTVLFKKMAQTRSMDEGMTTYYTCSNCGNNWTAR